MSHGCNALIVHCIDFRFIRGLHAFMGERGILDSADIVAVAGAAKPVNQEFILSLLASRQTVP